LHHPGIRKLRLKALLLLTANVTVSANGYAVFVTTETVLPSPRAMALAVDEK
jgi:hypothetical protein